MDINDEVVAHLREKIQRMESGVMAVLADMQSQISQCRAHGDDWEADFIEQFSKKLDALINKEGVEAAPAGDRGRRGDYASIK